MRRFTLPDQTMTERFARQFREHLKPGDIVLLEGPVGVGKSAFARAIVQDAMHLDGTVDAVPSPTFTLVQVYETSSATYWHADLYRLSHVEELAELGLEDAFEDAVTLIEWPERLGAQTPARHLVVQLEHGASETERVATILPSGTGWDWIATMPNPLLAP